MCFRLVTFDFSFFYLFWHSEFQLCSSQIPLTVFWLPFPDKLCVLLTTKVLLLSEGIYRALVAKPQRSGFDAPRYTLITDSALRNLRPSWKMFTSVKQFKIKKSAYLVFSFACSREQCRRRAARAAEGQRAQKSGPPGQCSHHHLPETPLQLGTQCHISFIAHTYWSCTNKLKVNSKYAKKMSRK